MAAFQKKISVYYVRTKLITLTVAKADYSYCAKGEADYITVKGKANLTMRQQMLTYYIYVWAKH